MSQEFAKVKAIKPIGGFKVGDIDLMELADAKDASLRGDVEILQNRSQNQVESKKNKP
jgi:hypothetical protein